MTCPDHKVGLIEVSTVWGVKCVCVTEGCTVACWDGSTSTPADAETRTLRKRCHELFDPLWKSGKWTRGKAYRWLQKQMNLTRGECHIGMFDKGQCMKLIELMGEAK